MKNKLTVIIVSLMMIVTIVSTAFCTYYGDYNHPTPITAEVIKNGGATINPEYLALLEQQGKTDSSVNPTTPAATQKPVEKKCDHEYTSEVTKEATCAKEGVKTFTCSKCGDTYTEAIPKTTSHTYVEKVTKEPTCTKKGLKTFTCSVCGDVYEREIDALGHDYKSEITTASTCTEKGVKTFTCSRCGDSYTEEIPATGHTEGEFEITKPAGWFTVGEQVQKCTVCGEILATEEIPSQYPIWYLYVAIAVVVLILVGITTFVVIKKKKIK